MEQTPQTYYNNGYNNTEYHQPKQQKFQNRKNYTNYQQYTAAASNQSNNNTIVYPQQYQQQHQYNNFKQHQQQNWGNKNKRSHDYVEHSPGSSLTASPEPKRQVQKQNLYQNPNKSQQQYTQNFQHAAYQTPNTPTMQPPMVPKFNKAIQKKKSNAVSPVVVIQEQKSLEWAETFKKTMSLLSGCKAGEEVNILISCLQSPRTTWVKTKDQIHNDLMGLMSPLGIEKVIYLVF